MSEDKREAMLYERLDDRQVRCNLCGHRCRIAPGKTGFCFVRKNVDGKLMSINYDELVAVHVDPIEKKPLFHFLPGTRSLSVAAAGCNFRCAFCQNWQISQAPREHRNLPYQEAPPEALVAAAQRNGCASMSYTYTEPTIFFELAYDTGKLAAAKGIRNCFVSNGYMTPEAVRTIAPYLDAINVDLKAFREETYRSIMKAHLEPVLTCLKELAASDIWLEVTTLVVPGTNDSEAELSDIAGFIASELGRDVPWHVSRFHGDYQMSDAPSTPVDTLHRAMTIGTEAGLRYVYCGNVPGDEGESTRCPDCGTMLIQRTGYMIQSNRLDGGKCPDCGTAIAGLWE